jgi:hypothetical protein
MTLMRKALFEELMTHIDREALARLLDLEPGYELQNIEADGQEFRFTFSRKTDLGEKIPSREERRRFLSWLRTGALTTPRCR